MRAADARPLPAGNIHDSEASEGGTRLLKPTEMGTDVKVVYRDGEQGTRVLKGTLAEEDGHFVTVKLPHSTIRIAKSAVLKIETYGDGNEDGPNE